MEKVAPASTASAGKKISARVALIDLDQATSGILHDCFKQFGIQTVAVSGDAVQRLRKEKFEACIVRLQPGAEQVLEAARSSPSNSRIVLYGIADNTPEAMRFFKYGINAVFSHPVERPAALKVVRGTHLLVLHEFRRYVRIPVFTEVKVEINGRRFTAASQEISGGGMSVKTGEKLNIGEGVELAFDLPDLPQVRIRASVCWLRSSDQLVGARFDAGDSRRVRIKEWIDSYLEASS